jgi:hypothetical protein
MRHWQLLGLALLAFTGCDSDTSTPPTTSATSSARPALATTPPKRGEIVLQGELSPKTHGPVQLHGTYEIRFQQYDPTDPHVRFAGQTPFVVDLERRQGFPAVHLFKSATATGSTRRTLNGRYWVDVSFGDFPYVVRFTPTR